MARKNKCLAKACSYNNESKQQQHKRNKETTARTKINSCNKQQERRIETVSETQDDVMLCVGKKIFSVAHGTNV